MKPILGAIVCVLVCATSAAAQSTYVSGNFSAIEDLFSSDSQVTDAMIASGKTRTEIASPIFIGGDARRLGRFRIQLDTQKHFRYTSDGQNFKPVQGMATVTGADGALDVPVAATIVREDDSHVEIRAVLLNEGVGRGIASHAALLGLNITLNKDAAGKFNVTKVKGPRYHPRALSRACGTSSKGLKSPATVPVGARRDLGIQAVFQTVTVIAEGDVELSSNTNVATEVATHFNAADLYYMRDFGVSLNVTIDTTPQPYAANTEYNNGTGTYALHEEMRVHRPASERADYLHFLITGKPNGDGLAGVVPDLGTICRSKEDSIGFTISYEAGSTFDIQTSAHEIGHLFGAEHDDQESLPLGYLMHSGTTTYGPIPDEIRSEFSPTSKAQVAAHLAGHSSCLGSEEGDIPPGGIDPGDGGGGGDTPVLSSLTAQPRPVLRYFRGRVVVFPYDQFEDPIRRGLTVELNCGTSAEGPFDVFAGSKPVRLRRARFIVWSEDLGDAVYCQASSGGVFSNVVQALLSPYE